jgi:hypothetical protein
MSEANDFPTQHICSTCFQPVEIKITKKQKPMWLCEGCQSQNFLRGKIGIQRLAEFKNNPNLIKKLSEGKYVETATALNLIEQIKILEFKIKRIREEGPIFFAPAENDQVLVLRKKIKALEQQLINFEIK